jgi:hypothetical protein
VFGPVRTRCRLIRPSHLARARQYHRAPHAAPIGGSAGT